MKQAALLRTRDANFRENFEPAQETINKIISNQAYLMVTVLESRDITMKTIREALPEQILILDSEMGTSLQAINLTAEDSGGKEFEGCNEYLVITKPDAIRRVTNSNGANFHTLTSLGATLE